MLDPSAAITGTMVRVSMGYRRPPGDCLVASFDTYLLKYSMAYIIFIALKLLCIQGFWNIHLKTYSDTHLIKKISIS